MTRLLFCLAYALTLLAWQEDRDIHLIRVQRRMALVTGNSAYPAGPCSWRIEKYRPIRHGETNG